MAVRDTSAWRHATLQRKVINLDHDGDRHVMCAWDTCEKDGYENYKVRVKTHADDANTRRRIVETKAGIMLLVSDERYMNYVFCSERHKMYWLNTLHPGSNNCLPPGWRLSIL